jgi:basic amino acid/polyamine antiporter, APA family
MQKQLQQDKNNDLRKDLGLFEAIAIVIGVVIGSGIFFKPSVVLGNAGAPGLAILAWVVGGIITIAAGLTVAEIAAAIPKTGGLFVYLKELYGERTAFLLGWVQTVIYVPGAAAALAIVFSTQATTFLPLTELQQKFLAIGSILLVTSLNILSTRIGGKVQFISTLGKLIPIFAIAIFGLTKGTVHGFTPLASSHSSAGGFGAAILGTLWAYDGWINVGNISGELKKPTRDLPLAIIGGLSLVMLAYITINLAVLNVLPVAAVLASKKAASDAAVVLFGTGGATFVSIGILISIFGALNGYLLTGSRIPLAMAKDGMIPFKHFFGKVTGNSKTPANALVFQSILASIYVFTGSFDTLTDLVVFVLWIFFTMAVAGVFILRSKHKELPRPFQVPLYPVIPLIGIVGGLFILLNTLLTNTVNALYGVGVTLIGIPVYVYLLRKKQQVN